MYKYAKIKVYDANNKLGYIVSLFFNSTHIAVLLNDYVYDMVSWGLRKTHISEIDFEEYVIEELYFIDHKLYRLMLSFMHIHKNTKYDWWEGVRTILKFINISTKDHVSRFNCVELWVESKKFLSKYSKLVYNIDNKYPMSTDEV